MIRNFTDEKILNIENYPYLKDGKELDLCLEVFYQVSGCVETHSHNVPWSEDTPDGCELEITSLYIGSYTVYDENGEVANIILSCEDICSIQNSLYERVEKDYYDCGSWGRSTA